MKLSEAVREIIRLGDASRAYWDRELPKYHPHYPLIRADEEPVPPAPEDSQIQALLKSLPEDQLYALILLTYVGRGDFRADDLLPAYQAMKETFPSKDLAIAQMTGEKTLAEYLTDAIEEIQKRHIDLDSIEFDRAVAVG
jgi:Protein of unknown function (DUF3775)